MMEVSKDLEVPTGLAKPPRRSKLFSFDIGCAQIWMSRTRRLFVLHPILFDAPSKSFKTQHRQIMQWFAGQTSPCPWEWILMVPQDQRP